MRLAAGDRAQAPRPDGPFRPAPPLTDFADVLFLGDTAGLRNCAIESQLRIACSIIELAEEHAAAPAGIICIDARLDVARATRRLAALRAIPELAALPALALVREGEGARLTLLQMGFTACAASLTELAELRRQLSSGGDRLSYCDLELDSEQYKVWRAGRLILLPTFQFRLLKFLMANPSRIFSRRELIENVWRDPAVSESAVTACMARLRRALSVEGRPDLLRNTRGGGYALDADGRTAVTKASFQLHRSVTPGA